MVFNKVLFGTILVLWLCSTAMSILVRPDPSVPSYILGGNPNYDTENDNYGQNCHQFSDDFDILRQLPFPIHVDPALDGLNGSMVQLNKDNRTVRMMYLIEEKLLPSSVFCLSKIDDLTLNGVHLKDGILPHGLKNMQTLNELAISDVPNLKIEDHFLKMNNLRTIAINNCSLTTFPDVSHLKFTLLSVRNNYLNHLNGTVDAYILDIENNYFQSLPVLKNPERIIFLSVHNNPITNITPILAYKNLTALYISQTNVSFIPPTIDRLQHLSHIDFSETKITHLPTTILNLPRLQYLNIKNTGLSSMQVQSIRKAFKTSHPNLELEF